MVTVEIATKLLKTSKPTAIKCIETLCNVGVLYETTGRIRDRVFAYRDYLKVPPDQIKDIKPLMTMVGGKVVYEAKMQKP